jgi:hypothetical protein
VLSGKEQDGKLIDQEEKNEGAISAAVYSKYLKSAGVGFVSLTLFLYLAEICCVFATDTYDLNFYFVKTELNFIKLARTLGS